jgi:hypothetical protein
VGFFRSQRSGRDEHSLGEDHCAAEVPGTIQAALARTPIEDLINREIRHNDERIRQQANDALAKALKARQIEIPLLCFLDWP